MAAGYCPVRTTGDPQLQTILVMKLCAYKLYCSRAVPKQGVDLLVTKHIVLFFFGPLGSTNSSTDVIENHLSMQC